MFSYAVTDTGGKEESIGVLPIAKRTVTSQNINLRNYWIGWHILKKKNMRNVPFVLRYKISLISRVFGPYCKLRTEFFSVNLWPKSEMLKAKVNIQVLKVDRRLITLFKPFLSQVKRFRAPKWAFSLKILVRIASYGPQIDQSHGENRLSHII